MDKVKEAIEIMRAAGVTYLHIADLVNLRLAKKGSDKRICVRTLKLAVKMDEPHNMHIDRRKAILDISRKFR